MRRKHEHADGGCVSAKLRKMAGAGCLLLFLLCLSACGEKPAPDPAEEEPLRVVTTIFPVYDWTREVLGSDAGETELTLLMDRGVDLHSFQPTAQDLIRISSCDLFVYVGGESDAWVEDALKEAVNPDMQVLSLMEVLGDRLREEERIAGMQEERFSEEEDAYDEHIWLSVRNAEICCGAVAEALAGKDPAHAEDYVANAAAYGEKLAALDSAFEETVREAAGKTVLFADRFPFRYLAEDYGLRYYAAFAGCAAETEASFGTILFLIERIDEEKLGAICVLKDSDGKLARTVRETTADKDQEIVVFDSMQATSGKDIEAGVTYLRVMEENLAALEKALAE